MNKSIVVLNVVGLTESMLGPDTPHMLAVARGGFQAVLETVFPAVTCTVQSSILTGLLPRDHGIVANGWYFRDLAEVGFWKQSNRLVSGEKIWEAARKKNPEHTAAQIFWWHNMYSTADISVTPRPAYPADGRKLPDIYTHPPDLRNHLSYKFGTFPLFHFWGPAADITSTEWIASAALEVLVRSHPTLTFVYLPHLDYNLQRLGPDDPRIREDLRAVDRVAGRLIDYARARGAEVIVLSEYGIMPVRAPVHINRRLREAGFLTVQDNQVGELLDAGASRAFAVADHQAAHVYVSDRKDIPKVQRVLEETEGVDRVLDEDGKKEAGLDHPRSGELVAVAAADRWFSYYYWLDDGRAPDFARTVDIHRKPGYDPAELILDPAQRLLKLKIGWKLFQKTLGFRTLMDVIPLDGSLVKGSHGRVSDDPRYRPVLLSSSKTGACDRIKATKVKSLILSMLH